MSIHLDGAEISIIKTLGFGGGSVPGDLLLERMQMGEAEFMDTLQGLVAVGYVSCDGGLPKRAEDLRKLSFQVNSGYAREIKEALDPEFKKAKPRRLRRE